MSMPTTKSTAALENIFRLYKYTTPQKPGKDTIIISMLIWISTIALKLISNLIYSNITLRRTSVCCGQLLLQCFSQSFQNSCNYADLWKLIGCSGHLFPHKDAGVALNLPATSKTPSALSESVCQCPPDRFQPLLISHLREKRRVVLFSNK